jgi:hypothetical protein
MTIEESKHLTNNPLSEVAAILLCHKGWRAEWGVGRNKQGYMIELCGNHLGLRAWIPKYQLGLGYVEGVDSLGVPNGCVVIAAEMTWGCYPISNGEVWLDLHDFMEYLEGLVLE